MESGSDGAQRAWEWLSGWVDWDSGSPHNSKCIGISYRLLNVLYP